MATIYSDVYSNASVTNNISYRTKVDYTVTDYDATIVIAGTVTLQAKGTFSGSVSSTYKKILAGFSHSALSSGFISTTICTTDKVTRGTTSYSSWTNLKSATFSETWSKYAASAHTEYLFPYFTFYGTDDVSHGTWGKPSTGTPLVIGAKTAYAVTYDANGGTNAPNAQTKYHDTTLKLSTAKPTRDNASFVKWSGSDGNDYQPGDNYTGNAALTLTAVWISVPQITSLIGVRCTYSGGTYTDDDEGTYARISCAWSIDPTIDAQASATVTGTITPQGGTASVITIESGGSGTSGTAIAHPSNLDPDTQYSVTITVTNGTQATSRTVIITRAFFIMDFKAGGGGIGIGRAAPASGLEVGYDATFDANVLMREDLSVTGDASAATVTDGNGNAISNHSHPSGTGGYAGLFTVAGRTAYPLFVYATAPDEADLPVTPCFVLATGDYGLWYYDGN